MTLNPWTSSLSVLSAEIAVSANPYIPSISIYFLT